MCGDRETPHQISVGQLGMIEEEKKKKKKKKVMMMMMMMNGAQLNRELLMCE